MDYDLDLLRDLELLKFFHRYEKMKKELERANKPVDIENVPEATVVEEVVETAPEPEELIKDDIKDEDYSILPHDDANIPEKLAGMRIEWPKVKLEMPKAKIPKKVWSRYRKAQLVLQPEVFMKSMTDGEETKQLKTAEMKTVTMQKYLMFAQTKVRIRQLQKKYKEAGGTTDFPEKKRCPIDPTTVLSSIGNEHKTGVTIEVVHEESPEARIIREKIKKILDQRIKKPSIQPRFLKKAKPVKPPAKNRKDKTGVPDTCKFDGCNRHFDNDYLLVQHIRSDHVLPNRSVQDVEKSNRVMEAINDLKPITCKKCLKHFMGIQRLALHRHEKHQLETLDPKTHVLVPPPTEPLPPLNAEFLQCSFCPAKNATRYSLKYHILTQHGTKNLLDFHCDSCEKFFCKASELLQHRRVSHWGDRPPVHTCDQCGKRLHAEGHFPITRSETQRSQEG